MVSRNQSVRRVSHATQALVEWIFGFSPSNAPGVEDTVKARLLDYLTNLLGGLGYPSTTRLLRMATQMSDTGEVPLPNGRATKAIWGSLPYGAAAHALEFDDTHQPSSTHPGAVVFSTAIPISAEFDVTFANFASAVVKGYEVIGRIAAASGPAQEYERGFHPTGTAGVFGAATAAASVMGATESQLHHALGVAGSLSSGSMAFLTNGSWSKHLHPGWAAHCGTTAAHLAVDGFQGPQEFLEGQHGYFAGHTAIPATHRLSEGLGTTPLVIERTSTKAHGCCRYEQAAIDAVLHLRESHHINPGQVEQIRIGVLSAGWNIVAEPDYEKRRPANTVDAQFSMPFGAAIALLQGRASPAEHSEANIHDNQIEDLMDRVLCYQSPDLEREYPEKWPAAVEIRLRDGTQLEHSVEYPKGDPENPFSLSELRQRLRDVCSHLPQGPIDDLCEAIFSLKGDESMKSLMEALQAVMASVSDSCQ